MGGAELAGVRLGSGSDARFDPRLRLLRTEACVIPILDGSALAGVAEAVVVGLEEEEEEEEEEAEGRGAGGGS